MRLDPLTYELLAKQQRELEDEMFATSQSRFMEKINKSMKDGTMPDQAWAAKMINGWIQPAADALRELYNKHKGSRGRPPVIMKYLEVLEPEVLAAIGVRSILHFSKQGGNKERGVTYQFHCEGAGKQIEDEYAVALMAKDLDTKEYQQIVQRANKAGRTRGRKILAEAEKRGYVQKADEEEQKKIGGHVLETIRHYSDLFDIDLHREDNSDKTNNYVVFTEAAQQVFDDTIDQAMYSPELGYWPMIAPPKQWGPDRKGGYLTGPVRRSYGFIRTRGGNHKHDKGLPDHSDAVYNAINRIQDTPYRINKGVLHVIEEMLAGGVQPPKMVPPDEVELPEPPDIDEDKKGTDEWNKGWSAYYKEHKQRKEVRDKLQGNLYEANRAIAIAQMMEDYNAVYFPWKADFRGRLYPIPQGLNPQGSKVAQGLLELAHGKPVGSGGAYWLRVHAANCFGYDKDSFDGRYQWAISNEEKMLQVAKDPIGTIGWWGKAEKPYQFLACCLEWPSFVENREQHVSHLAVQKDGSCNGLQHLSAISRDPATAKLVNLEPSDKPQDVYKVVADETAKLVKAANDVVGDAWLYFGIDRKVAKRPVMTLPYGSTFYAVGDFILEAVADRMGTSLEHPFPGTIHEATMWLKPHLWGAIKRAIPGARSTMDWLQGAVKDAAKANLPVSWTTPDGFHVIQAYRKETRTPIRLRVAGGNVKLDTKVSTGDIKASKQKSSIAPNFVHSLDGCHLRMYVNKAHEAGVSAFVMVHDSYGCHAADVDTMDRLIREAFVEMYQSDVTKSLLDNLAAQGTPYDAPLEIGSFDINQVMNSQYFFG